MPRDRRGDALTGRQHIPADRIPLSWFQRCSRDRCRVRAPSARMPQRISRFDAGYQVLTIPQILQRPVDAEFAASILQWPTGAIAPRSVLAWRDAPFAIPLTGAAKLVSCGIRRKCLSTSISERKRTCTLRYALLKSGRNAGFRNRDDRAGPANSRLRVRVPNAKGNPALTVAIAAGLCQWRLSFDYKEL